VPVPLSDNGLLYNQYFGIFLINFVFANGAAPAALADVNGDGAVDVSDVFLLINFLFAGGPAPL